MAQALVRIMQYVQGVVSHTREFAGLGQQPASDAGKRDTWLGSVLEHLLWASPNRQLLVVWRNQQLQPQLRAVAEVEGEGQPLLLVPEVKVHQLQPGSSP